MFIRVFSALILTLTLDSVQADADLERANLAKLVQEIDYLMSRVDQIKQDAGTNQRVVFHYDDLRLDLKKIRSGINDHIQQSITAGRKFKPLEGRYHTTE